MKGLIGIRKSVSSCCCCIGVVIDFDLRCNHYLPSKNAQWLLSSDAENQSWFFANESSMIYSQCLEGEKTSV